MSEVIQHKTVTNIFYAYQSQFEHFWYKNHLTMTLVLAFIKLYCDMCRTYDYVQGHSFKKYQMPNRRNAA